MISSTHAEKSTGVQQTTDNKQQTTDSRQQTANSRQQTADSRQQTADSRQQTADSRQQNFGHQDEAEGRLEERLQRERLVGGEERTGGRMPRETHKAVRDAQREIGIIWQNEEV
jgi:hypothetical protein